jgi:hypothetical protein
MPLTPRPKITATAAVVFKVKGYIHTHSLEAFQAGVEALKIDFKKRVCPDPFCKTLKVEAVLKVRQNKKREVTKQNPDQKKRGVRGCKARSNKR